MTLDGGPRNLSGVFLGNTLRTDTWEGQLPRVSSLSFCSFSSILKRTCLPLTERVTFSGKGRWPHLSLESIGDLAPVPIVGAEAVDVLNTGEKLFIFRSPTEPEISLHLPPRKKKKSFLNAKKAAWALGMN